jgi:hypothetical protein
LEIGDVLKTTGTADLDQSLIAEMNKQSAFFGFRPAFILYTGGEKNAAASLKRQYASGKRVRGAGAR